MKGRWFFGALMASIIKIAIVIVVIFFVYHVAINMYDFGYRVFAEEPVSMEPGETMTVTVTDETDILGVAKTLEEAGLIRDARLFYVQELVSSYKGEVKAGVYELNTAMTPEEMMGVMSASTVEEEEEQ